MLIIEVMITTGEINFSGKSVFESITANIKKTGMVMMYDTSNPLITDIKDICLVKPDLD
jgi:hypothetical protein